MTPTKFKGETTVFAKNQPQYQPLPAHLTKEGVMTCCWALSWRERITLLLTGRLWHQVLTFNKKLQPQLLHVRKPILYNPASGKPEDMQ